MAMKTHKGTYYFTTRKEAKDWARANCWPTNRIIAYGLGYAVQSAESGNYAGPGEIPEPFLRGTFSMVADRDNKVR